MSRKPKRSKKPVNPAEEYLKNYLNLLQEERKDNTPTLHDIKLAIQTSEDECARIKAEINRREALINQRKQEIKDWKAWYNGSPKIDKSEEWAKMDVEIAWRASEIQSLQAEVDRLFESMYPAKTQLEIARHRLVAYELGFLEKPLSEDPRYVGIHEALNAIQHEAQPIKEK